VPVFDAGRLLLTNAYPMVAITFCQLTGRLLRYRKASCLHQQRAFTWLIAAGPKERYVPNGWSGR